MTSERGRVAVIGGGMAGMTAAHRLKKAGFSPTVFERRDRVGGRMWSLRKGGFLMDVGMSAYLGTYREAIELIREVGLADEMSDLPAIGGFKRGANRHHIDYAKPLNMALTTSLISWSAKMKAIRIAQDTYARRDSLGYSDYTKLAEIDVETVEEYCKRVLNEELLHYMGQPLVSGTWVAVASDTSIALLFWTIRNMLAPSVYNLNGGVMALPEAIAERMDMRFGASVENVTDNGKGVEVTTNGAAEIFDGCVIATTAEPALAMYPQMDEITRALYTTVKYRKLGNICLGLSHRPADPATYFLGVPHEDPDTIAVIADHNKAPHRAPDGKGLLTVLLSHEYLERSEHLNDDDILDYAFDRAKQYYPDLKSDHLEVHNVVRWPESVPAIPRGRFRQITEYISKIDRRARVQFASDLDRIPGCNGALVSGHEAGERLAEALGRSPQ